MNWLTRDNWRRIVTNEEGRLLGEVEQNRYTFIWRAEAEGKELGLYLTEIQAKKVVEKNLQGVAA
jgi:hypothetical protein